jgi:hypothetical protein
MLCLTPEAAGQLQQRCTKATNELQDTTETNSLCCAAAGIIASSSAPAEALIPHEKLREAATSDATLIAHNRPPAQPVVGYTHVSGSAVSPWPMMALVKANTDQGIDLLEAAA